MAVTLNKANLVLKDANGNIGKIEQLSSNDLAKIKTVVSDVALVVSQSNHTPIEATTTNKGVVQLATSADVASGAIDKVVTAEQLHNATTGTSALATENLARIDAVVTEAGIVVDHTNTNQLKTAVTTLVNNAVPSTATSTTLGVVKPDNDTITIDSNGVLTATNALKAKQDFNGNDIVNTYATKAENINVLNQAKTDASQKYLPLAGGALKGNLAVETILRESTDNGLYLVGGTTWDNGARLILNGKDNADVKGGFDLGASDGKSTVLLSGRANGALYWGTKHLVRSINGIGADVSGNVVLDQSSAISASGTYYIRFANGTQICWGLASYNNVTSANITLPVPFANTYYQVLCCDTGDGRFPLGANAVATTYFTVYLPPAATVGFNYIAIGSWK